MSHAASNWAWWDARGLKPNAKLVLLALADYADDRNQCWPSYETLADKCDISRTSVYSAIKDLKSAALIRVTQRREDDKQLSNLYTLLTKKKAVKQADQSSDQSSDLSSDLSSDQSSDVCTQTVNRTVNRTVNQNPKEKGGVQKSKEVEFPSELDTPEFRKQWELYESYRTENRYKRLKPSSVITKLNEMAEWGHETAMDAVRQTIGNGWQGIFAPKSIPSKPRAEGAPQPKESSAQKPRSTWDIKQQIEAIDDRLNELRKHRAEVAGGDYVWDSPVFKVEYGALFSKRKQLNAQLINQ